MRAAGGNPDSLRLNGQEINLTTSAIAKMNLYLHGLEDFRIRRGDTFREPRFTQGSRLEKFDVVISPLPNPHPATSVGLGRFVGAPEISLDRRGLPVTGESAERVDGIAAAVRGGHDPCSGLPGQGEISLGLLHLCLGADQVSIHGPERRIGGGGHRLLPTSCSSGVIEAR